MWCGLFRVSVLFGKIRKSILVPLRKSSWPSNGARESHAIPIHHGPMLHSMSVGCISLPARSAHCLHPSKNDALERGVSFTCKGSVFGDGLGWAKEIKAFNDIDQSSNISSLSTIANDSNVRYRYLPYLRYILYHLVSPKLVL
jgi:hypothetical protein